MNSSLRAIAAVLGTEINPYDTGTNVTRVEVDSRRVTPGTLFFALSGGRTDGHDYVADAFGSGAVGAVVSRPFDGGPFILVDDPLAALQQLAAWHRSKFDIPVVAVTGSVGKTTTKDLLAAILDGDYPPLKTQGNYNNEIGLPLTLLNLNESHQAAVVEMGMSAPGEIAFLAELARPTGAIIVNVAPVHLENMGSLANIAQAKLEVIEWCRDFAVVNGDSPELRAGMTAPRIPVFWFGYGSDCDWKIIDIRYHQKRTILDLEIERVRHQLSMPFPAVHLAENLVAAVGTAMLLGVKADDIEGRLAQFKPSAGRTELKRGLGGSSIIDDSYNANPISMKAGLQVMAALGPSSRRIAVLGEMYELGDYEETGYLEVGKKVAEMEIEHLVTVGDRAGLIYVGAKAAGFSGGYQHFSQTLEAAHNLRNMLQQGDFVLIKASRGMHFEKIVEALSAAEENRGELQ